MSQLLLSKESVAGLAAVLLLHPLDTIKKNLQLNNQSKPKVFTNTLSVVRYYRNNLSLAKLYQGLTVSLVRQALYAPAFFLTLGWLEQHAKPF